MTHRKPLDFKSLLSAETRARSKNLSTSRTVATPAIHINLSSGQPDLQSLPIENLSSAIRQTLNTDQSALLYGDLEGYYPLRQVVVNKTDRLEALRIEADNVIITAGSSQAIGLAAQVFLNRASTMLIDEATWGAQLFRLFGPKWIPIRWDSKGPIMSDIERGLSDVDSNEPVRLFYTTPNFQNPMGITASLQRRKEIIALAQKHRFLILEDDAYGELRFAEEILPSYYELDETRSHVIRTGTFSKILGPGVRLGWAIGPQEILKTMLEYKFDLGSSPFMSRIVAQYMGTHLETHVAYLCTIYRRKRDAMLEALEHGLGNIATWSHPEGGFFVWVKLPGTLNSKVVERETMARGVDIWPGSAFRMDEREDGHIRLAYSLESVEKIREGVGIFSDVVRELIDSHTTS